MAAPRSCEVGVYLPHGLTGGSKNPPRPSPDTAVARTANQAQRALSGRTV